MTRLELSLFGSPLIAIDGVPARTQVDKAAALLALLALQGPRLPRKALADALWSDSEPLKARSALRMALTRLTEGELAPWLELDRDGVALSAGKARWVDVLEFQDNLGQSKAHAHSPEIACPECFPRLRRALELYRGDFMAGYFPHHTAGFDEWRDGLSNALHADFLTTLERLARGYYQHGQFEPALQMVNRWLVVDPYNEEGYSLSMRIYASLGQRANAIARYHAFTQLAAKKLDIEPSAEITALYQHILAGKSPTVNLSQPLKKPVLLLVHLEHASDRWDQQPILKESLLSRFSQGLKDNLRRYGGRIIQQSPQQFLILFEHGYPLQCAIAIQQSTAQTRWGLPEPLQVRMAVNTIPAAQVKTPLHASEVATCQLLVNAASGSQLLLTAQATQEIDFPASARPRDLGTYFNPENQSLLHIFEMVHPHFARTDHQPLRNLTRSPASLPLQATPFVGRESELKHIANLLHDPECRLLTLVGPGGVGKTRLSIQAISQLEITPPDSVVYVPLVSHHNAQNLHYPIAERLNLSLNNPSDHVAQLIDYLHPQRVWLLLDNFEHLLAGAPLLVRLLHAVPGLRILLTSQERLNLHLETVYEVRGLSLPPGPDDPAFERYSAVRLFLQNARRVAPGFRLRPEDRAHILRICTLVEGLPLGIELASAWVRTLSCRAIANALSANFDSLYTKRPDLPERHRSLRAAFNYSWELLSEEDRHALGRLSIFAHGFSADAAQKLANVAPERLAGFVDKSILSSQLAGRHHMPETIRAFVVQQMQGDPQAYESLAEAHGEYYLTTLAGMLPIFSSEHGAAALKQLGLDMVNLREALHWAIEHRRWASLAPAIDPFLTFFELQGRFREGLDDAHTLLEHLTSQAGLAQADLYHSLLGWEGWFAFCSGFKQEGLEKLHRQSYYAQQQGDLAHSAYTNLLLANAYARMGSLELARQRIEQSLADLDELPGTHQPMFLGIRGSALSMHGVILILLNHIEQARQVLLQAESALQRSGARYGLIRLFDAQARLANKDHHPEESYRLRQQALVIAEEFNDRRRVADLLNNLAQSAENLGDFSLAYDYSIHCMQLCNELGDRHLSAVNTNNLGFLTLKLHRPLSEALAYYQKSLAIFRETEDELGAFFTLRDIARAYLQADNLELAHLSLHEALRLGCSFAEAQLALHLIPLIARLLFSSGQVERAAQLCSTVIHHPQAEAGLQRDAQELLSEIAGTQAPGLPPRAEPGEPILPTWQALLAMLHE